jgi:hypothetical protein
MTSKEKLLQEADALRDLARHTRRVAELAVCDNQEKALRRHADDFDKQAGLLESEAASAMSMPTVGAWSYMGPSSDKHR